MRDAAHHDLIILAPQPAEVRWPGGVFHGQALWVRRSPAGAIEHVFAVRAARLELDGRTVISQPTDLFERSV